jgi:hypothetical protein
MQPGVLLPQQRRCYLDVTYVGSMEITFFIKTGKIWYQDNRKSMPPFPGRIFQVGGVGFVARLTT